MGIDTNPPMISCNFFKRLSGNEEKPEMEVNRTSFKTNLSLDEILSKMKKDNFSDDFVSNPNLPYYICNKQELEIRNVQIN